jgi:hypothetical protein
MKQLNLPSFDYKILEREGKTRIFDNFRKRYVLLTPEEWVRQHFLAWLTTFMAYPVGRIAVETSLKYGQLKKRADAIVFGKSGAPLMIIECKAPEVMLTQEVFDQVARYNFSFRVGYVAVTNGLEHYCCRLDPGRETWTFLDEFPGYKDISGANG